MKNRLQKISILGLLLTLSACATAPFKVSSEPDQAKVYLVDSETKEKKELGLTPVLKTAKEIKELMGGNISAGQTLNIYIEKDGYQDKEIWLPASAGGNLGTQINVTLQEGLSSSEKMKTAGDIVDKLFLSQKYAKSQQFERALIEIDKVLETFPEFDRALTMKAAILYGQGSFKESLKWYENALEINPELQHAIDMSAKIRKTLKMPVRIPASTKSSKKESKKL